MWKTSFAVLALVLALGACSSKKDSALDSTSSTTGAGVGSGIDRGAVGPGTQADLVANVGDRVFFELDRSDITQEGRATLGRQAEWLKKYSNVAITVEGHADERGTREYNLALGERRATAVKNYLVANGIPRRASRPSATARSVLPCWVRTKRRGAEPSRRHRRRWAVVVTCVHCCSL